MFKYNKLFILHLVATYATSCGISQVRVKDRKGRWVWDTPQTYTVISLDKYLDAWDTLKNI